MCFMDISKIETRICSSQRANIIVASLSAIPLQVQVGSHLPTKPALFAVVEIARRFSSTNELSCSMLRLIRIRSYRLSQFSSLGWNGLSTVSHVSEQSKETSFRSKYSATLSILLLYPPLISFLNKSISQIFSSLFLCPMICLFA